MKKKNGFTLIELLIVVVILGVLAGLTVPRLAGRTEKAKLKAAKSDITGGISLALDLYESDTGHYPDSLEKLVEDAAPNWDGPYIKSGIPKDPWGGSYIYKYPGVKNKRGYDLSTAGPDGKTGTEDDIANWKS